MQCQASPSTCGTESTAAAVPTKQVPIEVHEKEVDQAALHGHHLFAALFLFIFFSVCATFSMVSSSNKVIATNTWTVLDSIAVTSMAITIFYLCTHMFHVLTAGAPHWKITLHVVWALTIFFVAMFGSYHLQGNKVGQASFNAVLYWMCLLAKGGTLSAAQSELGSNMTHVCMITGGALLFFAVLIFTTHQIKPEPKWYDSVETGLASGALAAGVCSAVHLLINGMDHTPNKPVNASGTMMFNVFAIFTCVAAVLLTPLLGRMHKAADEQNQYWKGRILQFCSGFVGIMPYFTVSVGSGVIVCHLLGVHPATLLAKLVAAAVAVTYGFLLIGICAKLPYFKSQNEEVQTLSGLILGFGGYIAGYAIAALLTGSIDQIIEGRGLEDSQKTQIKVGITAAFNAVLIPVYVFCLKPAVMKNTA